MPASTSGFVAADTAAPGVEAWWGQYLHVLSEQRVAETALPWYRRRVEQLLKRCHGKRSAALEVADVEAHLDAIGGSGLPVWQLEQTLDALRRFGVYTHGAWVEEVDWLAWRQR